jgi:hypothetical protein
MLSSCAFNFNLSLLRRYIQALVPGSGNKKYEAVWVPELPVGASAAGIRAGCANVLVEKMPGELVVMCTGHELMVGWCS